MSKLIIKLLFIISFALPSEEKLTACYKAYFFILPVAESCITYRYEEKLLRIESFIKTTSIGGIFYKIDNFGVSLLKEDLSEYDFFLLQEEGGYKRDIYYHKRDGKLHMFITRYNEGSVSDVYYGIYYPGEALDPISASIFIYCSSFKRKSGYVRLFYDGRVYKIPFFVIGEEDGLLLVELTPKIYTKGIIKPSGRWLLWLDKEMKIPVKMELEFTLGSAFVELEHIKGNRKVLRRFKMCK